MAEDEENRRGGPLGRASSGAEVELGMPQARDVGMDHNGFHKYVGLGKLEEEVVDKKDEGNYRSDPGQKTVGIEVRRRSGLWGSVLKGR